MRVKSLAMVNFDAHVPHFPSVAYVLQVTVPDQSMEQVPERIVPPSKESCNTIPSPANTFS
jgi:hypothetical protein